MTHLEVEEFHISIFSVYMILRIGVGFCVIYFFAQWYQPSCMLWCK